MSKIVPLTKTDLQHSLNHSNDNLFCFHSITIKETTSALCQLHVNTDHISTAKLKPSAKKITPILTHIFNHLISFCGFLTQWKQAIALPIFKKGDSSIISNYQIISLLSVISKTSKRLLALQLTKFIEQNKVISSGQHGF